MSARGVHTPVSARQSSTSGQISLSEAPQVTTEHLLPLDTQAEYSFPALRGELWPEHEISAATHRVGGAAREHDGALQVRRLVARVVPACGP